MSVFKEKWGDKMVHVKLKAFLLRTEEWVRQWHGKVAFEEKRQECTVSGKQRIYSGNIVVPLWLQHQDTCR